MRGTNSLYTSKSVIAIAAMFFIWSISLEGSAQSDIPARDSLPSAISFAKELQNDFAKGDAKNSAWLRKVFTNQFLRSSTPKSIQDTIISTTLQLQSIHLKNSSGIIGYLRGVSEQLDTGVDSVIWGVKIFDMKSELSECEFGALFECPMHMTLTVSGKKSNRFEKMFGKAMRVIRA